MSKLKLYYHEPSDKLGIGEPDWDYVCLVRMVAVAARLYSTEKAVVRYDDPIEYVEHGIAEPKNADWIEIGEF